MGAEGPANAAALPFDEELFHLLVCPESRQPLKFVDERLVSIDPSSRRAYRVVDGIPIMLLEESEQLDEDRWRELMDREGPIGGGVAAADELHGSDAG